VRWQKQDFIHTRLSRAYLALGRLTCIIEPLLQTVTTIPITALS